MLENASPESVRGVLERSLDGKPQPDSKVKHRF
jgi:hypothetical protein